MPLILHTIFPFYDLKLFRACKICEFIIKKKKKNSIIKTK